MTDELRDETAGAAGGRGDAARDDEAHELEAEQESAEAMDADVPQPADASRSTEGQPS